MSFENTLRNGRRERRKKKGGKRVGGREIIFGFFPYDICAKSKRKPVRK